MKASKNIRLLTALAGILTAAVIVVTQLFCFELSGAVDQEIKTEQQSQSTSDQEPVFVSVLSYSMPSSVHILPGMEFTFIEELLLDSGNTTVVPTTLLQGAGKLFKALFSVIISPNAP
jgi:hypothetical protein